MAGIEMNAVDRGYPTQLNRLTGRVLIEELRQRDRRSGQRLDVGRGAPVDEQRLLIAVTAHRAAPCRCHMCDGTGLKADRIRCRWIQVAMDG